VKDADFDRLLRLGREDPGEADAGRDTGTGDHGASEELTTRTQT